MKQPKLFGAMVAAALCLFMAGRNVAAIERKVISVEPRSGAEVKILLLIPDAPKKSLIMLPGGPGYLDLSGTDIRRNRGFMASNAEEFAEKGYYVALVEAPTDLGSEMPPRFRQTGAHLKDLDAVIERVKKESGLPVWMMGISRSTISVIHAATNIDGKLQGIAVLSSVTRIPPRAGVTNLDQLPLGNIKIPALALAHQDDECPEIGPGHDKLSQSRSEIFVRRPGCGA